MAVDASADIDNATPNHGDTITFTYSVTGNDPIDPEQATISGVATVGGQEIVCTTTMTLPGTPAASESFGQPSGGGLNWVSTPNAKVFTAVVP